MSEENQQLLSIEKHKDEEIFSALFRQQNNPKIDRA
jgi:hypothetical protein